MSEEQLLFNRLTQLDKAIHAYEKRNDPKELLALIYIDPVYGNDMIPGIYNYFRNKFEEMKEEYKKM